MLASAGQPPSDTAPVPVEVAREPLPQLETALSSGAVPPRRGHLRDAQSEPVSLDRELEPQLETADRLNRNLVEQPLGVQAEVARRVMYRQAADPVQRETGRPRHGPLQKPGAQPGA